MCNRTDPHSKAALPNESGMENAKVWQRPALKIHEASSGERSKPGFCVLFDSQSHITTGPQHCCLWESMLPLEGSL